MNSEINHSLQPQRGPIPSEIINCSARKRAGGHLELENLKKLKKVRNNEKYYS